MIPSSLKIDPRLTDRIIEWMEARPPEEDSEDCCMYSRFTFHGYASGIGDSWWVSYGESRLYFGIDDDNEPYFLEEQKEDGKEDSSSIPPEPSRLRTS